ncbi:LAQU0S19e01288g1_1 [Lachancea quebecensis]|uniref:LAQU0S19e01288g1_1 n=1 Tax=Lachancea quebecensis TaxID=1654605 RepID=A0A0P1KZC4_9SACH|nr:LAQU0S19e01288g1_1 [Lachancea quebecensis]
MAISVLALFLGLTTDSKLTYLTSDHDKAAHFTVFFLESWLFTKSVIPRKVHVLSYTVDKYILSLLVCAIGAGVGSEFVQKVLSRGRRQFDLMDIACNICGGALGVAVAGHTEFLWR